MDNVEKHWSKVYDSGRDFTLTTWEEISNFLAELDSSLPKTHLDIGCGTGQLTREMQHRGFTSVGIDASSVAIKIARSLTTAPVDELNYINANIEQEQLTNVGLSTYSVVTCRLVYAFIKDKTGFLRKVAELLDTKGVFVLATPLVNFMPEEKRGISVEDSDIVLVNKLFKLTRTFETGNIHYFIYSKA